MTKQKLVEIEYSDYHLDVHIPSKYKKIIRRESKKYNQNRAWFIAFVLELYLQQKI